LPGALNSLHFLIFFYSTSIFVRFEIPLNHISLLLWRVTFNLNERILKLWRSNCPFGAKVGESDFFTASGGFMGILPGFKSSPSSPTLHATFNSSLLLKSCLTNLRIKMFISTSNQKWNIRIIRLIDFEI